MKLKIWMLRNFNIKYNLLYYETRDLFLQNNFHIYIYIYTHIYIYTYIHIYIYIHIYKDFAIILLNR